MKNINKTMFVLFIIWIIVLIIDINEYFTYGTVKTKWGVMTGNSALHTLLQQ